MKKIDTHQHYWLYETNDYSWISDDMLELKQDRLPEHIAPCLALHNIDGCIAVQARQCEQENQFLLSLAEKNTQILGVIGWVDLTSSQGERALENWNQYPLMKGYRHLIQDEVDPDAFFLNPNFNRNVDLILNQKKIYEILIHEKNLSSAIQFCKKHDHASLVLDHLGKPNIAKSTPKEWRKKIAPLATQEHVVCKLSGLITEAGENWHAKQIEPFIDIALEIFGPKRLMFGSDWPVCLLAGKYLQVHQLIEQTIKLLSHNEQADFWAGNAQRTYKLD